MCNIDFSLILNQLYFYKNNSKINSHDLLSFENSYSFDSKGDIFFTTAKKNYYLNFTGDRVQSQDLADSTEAESRAQCKVKLVSPQNNFLAGSDALFEDIFSDCRAHNPYLQQHLASSLRLGTNPQPQLANRPTLVAPKLAHNINKLVLLKMY